MSFFTPAPPPATKLAVYRQLSTTAGVHVSPLCLGAMSIGDQWSAFMGSMDKDQNETSEQFLGEWAEKRGIRDQLFIATKYSTNFKLADPSITQKVHYTGNGSKSLHLSVNGSLKKLRTDYIDLLYVHWWDYETSIEEVMRGLHALVMAGKVLYIGISDTPAWIVAKANQYARDHALTPFSVYQGLWNVMDRDFERDIIPMARSEGMALCPWNVIGGGKFRTDAEEEARKSSGENGRTMLGDWLRNEREKSVSAALEKVANEVGTKHIAAVAIAYVLQKVPYVFPLIGGRKVEHLLGNIEALDIHLTDEQIKYLEGASDFNIGFPGNFIGTGTTSAPWKTGSAHYAPPILLQAIRPGKN
ncbi:hypothetical protein H0H93_014120 [Arthromyces matolae]|nr:hypothetical protein H0H93_014120 [Arthromyces matolae]